MKKADCTTHKSLSLIFNGINKKNLKRQRLTLFFLVFIEELMNLICILIYWERVPASAAAAWQPRPGRRGAAPPHRPATAPRSRSGRLEPQIPLRTNDL